jgi:hypothetical protein
MSSTINSSSVRNPARRARSIGYLLVFAPVLAWESLNAAWYMMAFDAPTLVLPKSFTTVENVTATAIFTGWDLTKPGTAGSFNGVAQAIPVIAGYPSPFVYLTIGVLITIAGTFMRSTLLSMLGIVPMFLAHHFLGVTRNMVENPIFGGQYMHSQPAMWRFSLIVLAAIALSAIVASAVFIANRHARRAKMAAGDKVEPSLLDLLSAYNSRILDQAQEMQERNRRSESVKL